MDLQSHFVRMAENNRWSNDRLHRAVLQLKPGEFELHRVGFFPSLKETLNHVLAVDLLYLDFITEGGRGAKTIDEDFTPIDDRLTLALKQAETDVRLIDFCQRLSLEDLERRVNTDREQDGQIPERIGDLLTHLFLHQAHHRGQAHAMLSGTSVAPPQLDEFFLDYDLPRRRDEVRRLGFE